MHLRADPGRDGRRQQPDTGDDAGHQHRPHLQFAGADHRTDAVEAILDELVELREDDDAVHDRNAEQRDESDRGRHTERHPRHVERENAADDRHRDDAHGKQRVGDRGEIDP